KEHATANTKDRQLQSDAHALYSHVQLTDSIRIPVNFLLRKSGVARKLCLRHFDLTLSLIGERTWQRNLNPSQKKPRSQPANPAKKRAAKRAAKNRSQRSEKRAKRFSSPFFTFCL